MTDARARLELAREIWTEGRISLEPSRVSRRAFWIPLGNGRVVSYYGIGQSLAFLPFDAAGCVLSAAAGARQGTREFVRWLPVGLGLLPLLGVGWWFLLREILREAGIAPGRAAALSAAALLTTLAFFYVANEQEESLVGFLVAAALLCALRWKRTGGAGVAAAAGAFSGAAFLTRFDSIFGLLPVGLVFAGETIRSAPRRRRLETAAIAASAFAAFAASALLYNRARFGSPFETGYGAAGLSRLWRIDARCPGTALALLFGPGKGWFVLSPILLAALFGLPAAFRRLPLAGAGAALGFSAAVAFDSAFQGNSDGPWSWGTRYLAYFVTFWCVPLAFAMEKAAERRWRWRAALAVAGLSAVIQLSSVFITQNLEYVRLRETGTKDWSVLMTSARRGQLARRFRNIGAWLSGPRRTSSASLPPNEWMPPGSDREKAEFIEARYIPNFWGPAFAKLLNGPARRGVLLLWSCCLAAGVGLLALSLPALWRGEADPR